MPRAQRSRGTSRAVPEETASVEAYLERAPTDARPKLREIRRAIRAAAPAATETIGYGMPFYAFPGESGVRARLCYFGWRKGRIVFYSRPVYVDAVRTEAQPYLSTKSSLHFPLDRPMPVRLVAKLVKQAVTSHQGETSAPSRRGRTTRRSSSTR
jgi:uncharacterized protein YdhG (YjbR/CyaY superfamily)